MTFQARQLNQAEISRLLNASDSDTSGDSDVGEEDCLVELQIENDGENAEIQQPGGQGSDEETEDHSVPSSSRVPAWQTRQRTRSEKILHEADLKTLQQEEATYSVERGNRVTAEWSTQPDNVHRRRDRANILRVAPGLKSQEAKGIQTEAQAFSLYINNDITNNILEHTNKKLEEARQVFTERAGEEEKRKKAYVLALIDATELRAFIGLMVLRASLNAITVNDMFAPAFGPALARATMGQSRYLAILSHLTFDDSSTREARRPGDKFCLMREVFDIFDANLRRHIIPSENLTVDESLIKYRGRCPFRVYMPQKPGRYGILVRTVADAHSRYLWKAWVYPGKPTRPESSPPDTTFNKVDDLVRYLVKDVTKSGRNVTMDRYFTSVPLVEELRDAGLSVVGTLRANRALLPREMTSPTGREADSTQFAYRNGVQLTSFCPRAGKVVLVASTMHKLPLVDAITKKPEPVLFYNCTKGGVDIIDAIIEDAGASAGVVKRWPTRVFNFMVAAACLNGHHVFTSRFPKHQHADIKHGGRRNFCRALAEELTLPQVERRAAIYHKSGVFTMQTVNAISAVLHRDVAGPRRQEAGPSQALPAGPERGRCRLCMEEMHGEGFKHKEGAMAKAPRCSQCGGYACKSHSVSKKVCRSCSE